MQTGSIHRPDSEKQPSRALQRGCWSERTWLDHGSHAPWVDLLLQPGLWPVPEWSHPTFCRSGMLLRLRQERQILIYLVLFSPVDIIFSICCPWPTLNSFWPVDIKAVWHLQVSWFWKMEERGSWHSEGHWLHKHAEAALEPSMRPTSCSLPSSVSKWTTCVHGFTFSEV